MIVTDDNPRSEDPAAIRAAVLAGAPGAIEIGGRREAIAAAIADGRGGRHRPARRQGPRDRARSSATRVLPFDDVAVARECAGMKRRCWTVGRDRRRDRRHAQARAVRGRPASPSTAARSSRATCSSRCRARRTTGIDFVDQAFAAGAAGAIVSQPVDGPHVLVADTAEALERSRPRSRASGRRRRIIGVTGSVGKTSTKEALYAALDRCAPGRVHRSVKSYNNHTGVPLSLARMPRDSRLRACSKWA